MNSVPTESNTGIALIEGPAVQFGPCDVPTLFAEQVQLSDRLADAGAILPDHLRKNPAAIHGVMLAARSLDLPMWTAFQHLYVVHGSIEMSARLMRALVRRAGHRILPIVDNPDRVVFRLDRCDDPFPNYYAEFSMRDAATAGLLNKDNWLGYPRPMLRARATSALVNLWCPEVLNGGAYLMGERPADDGEDTSAIEAAETLDAATSATTLDEVSAIGKRARAAGLLPVYLQGQSLEWHIRAIYARMKDELGPDDDASAEPAPEPEPEAEVVHTPIPMARCGCTVQDAAMHGRQCPREMAAAFGPDWDDDVL